MTKLELINPEKASLAREKNLEEILAMTFDPTAKTELEKIVAEIRALKQRITRLETSAARQISILEGRKHRPADRLRIARKTLELNQPS